jgi:exonuclease III
VLLLAALVAALGAGCDEPPASYNRPPTVTIVSGPEGLVEADSARFTWAGQDRDGNLAGFLIALDDSLNAAAAESTGVTLRSLNYGRHSFYVRAIDDSGAVSEWAVRTFDCVHTGGIRVRGTDTTFEIATWNIENFPKAGGATLAALRTIIPLLGIDLFAVQEIADTISFQQLVAGLAGFDGLYSSDDYGSFYQKTGVLYRTDVVSITSVRQLFRHNDSVTRPPLDIQAVATVNGRTFDFELIVVHLKAGGTDEDRALRQATCRLMKGYIDDRLQGGADPDIIVAGDWNDELSDPPSQNSFQVFLDDTTNYRFLTMSLVGNSRQSSYIGGGLIDHVMVTRDALGEYGSGWTETLRLDDEVANYRDQVSDHRPVMAVFPNIGGRQLGR